MNNINQINPEIIKANNSYSPTFSKNAIVPKFIEKNIDKSKSILDFGSGKNNYAVNSLKEKGFMIDSHEFGKNYVEGMHTPNALYKKYDIVYSSNVINIQSNVSQLRDTLTQIYDCTNPDGKFIFNFPKSPRYIQLTEQELIEIVKLYFRNIEIQKFNSTVIYICSNCLI